MITTQSKGWNAKKLTQFGHILSVGYDPGLGDDAPRDKTWTTQTQCRTAQMLGRGYNPGL
ncbi:hypothetical protein GFS31_20120 [Leptolyngbya sp. BL0902]|uniref:hypothetical protein n=1 Tax=Leptolyngbya sp. BL0902 TaxID=1115757 RepID=UPI0018E7BD00|nr:hypothetical protein [Leptolyngbya sp. BL0902]QQE65325.1 hypothetical protein GFS31_20120 [Leptolyngbya sp. BL0902]